MLSYFVLIKMELYAWDDRKFKIFHSHMGTGKFGMMEEYYSVFFLRMECQSSNDVTSTYHQRGKTFMKYIFAVIELLCKSMY